MTEYEYGIRFNANGDPHRTGMTEDEALEWLEEWLDMGGRPEAFSLIRREIRPWESVPVEVTSL